jgi:hypothetical protein
VTRGAATAGVKYGSAEPKGDAMDVQRQLKLELDKISSRSKGIEWLVAAVLCLLQIFLLSFWLQRLLRRICRRPLSLNDRREQMDRVTEVYVVVCIVVTVFIWWMPTLAGAIICSYFSWSTIVVLLHVVFLSKPLGDVASPERSLILFICNVTQVVFMFSIWYQLEAHLPKGDALFNTLLVLGTLGSPDNAKVVVGLQIATDFLLLAIFLAHLVGRVGYPPQD